MVWILIVVPWVCQTLEGTLIQSKIPLHQGVVAESHEIEKLHLYHPLTKLERCYPKPFASVDYQNLFSTSPYRFLRSQWRWAIGPEAVEILDSSWKEHGLSWSETSASKLKPCLLRAFLKATQSAKGPAAQDKLRRSLKAFEGNFFALLSESSVKEDYRFILLAQLQSGLSDDLFLRLQTGDGKNPSEKISQSPDLAFTRLAFQQACRQKNWIQACRKMMVLKKRSLAVSAKDLDRILQGLERDGAESRYRIPVLMELARKTELGQRQRTLCAQKAWELKSSTRTGGELDLIVLELFAPKQSQWAQAFSRVYKSAPLSHRWTRDFHFLGQCSSALRRQCRTIFDILRHSKLRARHTLRESAADQLRLRVQALGRLAEVRKKTLDLRQNLPLEVRRERCYKGSAQLSSSIRESISQMTVALALSSAPKQQVSRSISGFEVRLLKAGSKLAVGPDFLTLDESEQRFLLARSLYRHVSGLTQLERAHQELSSSRDVLQKAADYCDWRCYHADSLHSLLSQSDWSREEASLVLQELSEDTSDPYLEALYECLAHSAWSPQEDIESLRFACSYSDVVSASHVLVKEAFALNNVDRLCLDEGLGSLANSSSLLPKLCLDLQRLWCCFLKID